MGKELNKCWEKCWVPQKGKWGLWPLHERYDIKLLTQIKKIFGHQKVCASDIFFELVFLHESKNVVHVFPITPVLNSIGTDSLDQNWKRLCEHLLHATLNVNSIHWMTPYLRNCLFQMYKRVARLYKSNLEFRVVHVNRNKAKHTLTHKCIKHVVHYFNNLVEALALLIT